MGILEESPVLDADHAGMVLLCFLGGYLIWKRGIRFIRVIQLFGGFLAGFISRYMIMDERKTLFFSL